jgi:hypothetical protein
VCPCCSRSFQNLRRHGEQAPGARRRMRRLTRRPARLHGLEVDHHGGRVLLDFERV